MSRRIFWYRRYRHLNISYNRLVLQLLSLLFCFIVFGITHLIELSQISGSECNVLTLL